IRDHKPGNVFLALVHRLDRPVGGVMVFAKTSKAASRLSDEIRKNKMERKYVAVVHGMPTKKTATLQNYLIKDKRENKVYAVSKHTQNAKKAILDYEVKCIGESFSFLIIQLHTGRPHQIRVQLA